MNACTSALRRLAIALLLPAALLAACTSGGGAASPAASPTASTQSPPSTSSGQPPSLGLSGSQPVLEPGGSVPSPSVVDLPASVIAPIVADAARRAGVPVDQVTVIYAHAQTFPDGSLGCPLPGMAYPQIVTDGYRVVVEAGGVQYDYRGTGGAFRWCDHSASPGPT